MPVPEDPERALSLAYAPREARAALSALWRLDERLAAIVARTETPGVGQIRLTWWHDALLSMRTAAPVDPLLIDLAVESAIDPVRMPPLIDGWEILLDPLPLSDAQIEAHARGRGGTLFMVAGEVLGQQDERLAEAGRLWALADLAARISDPVTAARARALAPQVRGRWPRRLRALGVLAVLAKRDVRQARRVQGSPGRVARAMVTGMTGI